MRTGLLSTLVAAGLALMGLAAGDARAVEPGSAPHASDARRPEAGRTSGLKVFYQDFGKLRLAVDAAGGAATNTIKIRKPAEKATVEKAFLLTSVHGVADIPKGAVTLEGKTVTWMAKETNSFDYFTAVAGDVTKIVAKAFDKPGASAASFKVKQFADALGPDGVFDGHILAVVFRTPKDDKPRTIALLFGAQIVGGDVFELALKDKIDPKAKGARADMGLGISNSYQSGSVDQSTVVRVNGKLLTSSAGGEDDGKSAESGLITVGGFGDRNDNPKPGVAPKKPRSDDELYSLLPFLTKKSRSIRVETSNASQDDNLFFAWFDLSAETDFGADQDGDGLLDVWETKGLDFDGDGKIDLDLKALGANPRRKDLFIAYAWMQAKPGESASHQPTAETLTAVTQAFARAPVSNPDGSTGVTVHFKDLGGVAHDDDLSPVWDEFDAIMNPRVSPAERRVYHRMLNAHGYNGGSSSGISRDIPASDFVESLGRFPSNPGTLVERAGTIMHELGHNLGLRHGGVDHENYKPNHLSIMSYLNQLEWLQKDGAPWLDYERFDLADLDENALSEPAGLDAAGAEGDVAHYGVRWYAFSRLREKAAGADANVDWNANGVTETALSLDINRSGARTVLRQGFPEWSNLIFDGGQIGASEPLSAGRRSLVTSPADLVEITAEEYERMKSEKRTTR